MGSAASTSIGNWSPRPDENDSTKGINKKVRSNRGIFDGSASVNLGRSIEEIIAAESNGSKMNNEEKELIRQCFVNFFLTDDCQSKIDLFISAMSREEMSKGELIISEGDTAEKLYVITIGRVNV